MGKRRGLLKIGSVLFSLSLLFGYVCYEQNRAGDDVDGEWKIGLDEEKIEWISFSSDEQWLGPENTAVLMPSSKNISMPLFRKGRSRLDRFDGGSENSSEENPLRTLMHSSKLSVFVFARIEKDPGEGAEDKSENTLDVRNAKGGNIEKSTFEPNDPFLKPENVDAASLMRSSKSGPVFFRPKKKVKDKSKGPKRRVMPSTKSFPLLNQ